MLGSLTIRRLMGKMKELQASDLHIKVGSTPLFRIASKLHQISSGELTADDTTQLLTPIVPEHIREHLETSGGVDFSFHLDEGERFRCSVFRPAAGYTPPFAG